MVGPRIFHTGSVIYGGGLAELHQDVVNMQEAKSALIRVKAEGGPSSFSYKNYQLPIRFITFYDFPFCFLLILQSISTTPSSCCSGTRHVLGP